MNPLVVRQQHTDLAGQIHPLLLQNGADRLSDQGTVFLIIGHGHISRDRNIVGLSHGAPPYFFFALFAAV